MIADRAYDLTASVVPSVVDVAAPVVAEGDEAHPAGIHVIQRAPGGVTVCVPGRSNDRVSIEELPGAGFVVAGSEVLEVGFGVGVGRVRPPRVDPPMAHRSHVLCQARTWLPTPSVENAWTRDGRYREGLANGSDGLNPGLANQLTN